MKRRVKCLLVDDLEENLLALSALLRDESVEVLEARSGAEALELLLLNDCALAFVDVQMPEMDGFELAELMRSNDRTRHVPIIFVTAGTQDRQRIFKGYDLGAVDFLYKPIEPAILKNKASVFFQLFRQKLQLAEQLAERTETLRLNEMFIAVLSHDLRNPLNAIYSAAELMNNRSNDDMVKAMSKQIKTSGGRMRRMLDDLLDLARVRLGGGLTVQAAPADLGQVAAKVVGELQAVHAERHIAVELQGDLAGRWDADRMAQLISNLLGNALTHGTASEPIELMLDGTTADRVWVKVANAGVIAPELLWHLFEPFRRGERKLGQRDGLGLGLHIVSQIAERHGGSVKVESSEAAGTMFSVELPRSAQGAPAHGHRQLMTRSR